MFQFSTFRNERPIGTLLDYPQRHVISTAEYPRMGDSGVFAADARLELIEGEIVEMAPIGSWHAGAVNILNYIDLGRNVAIAGNANSKILINSR